MSWEPALSHVALDAKAQRAFIVDYTCRAAAADSLPFECCFRTGAPTWWHCARCGKATWPIALLQCRYRRTVSAV